MKIVIVGTDGRLGGALMRAYRDKFQVVGFDREMLDLEDEKQITNWISPLDFEILINCAAFTNLDACEAQPEQAFQINAEAPKILAEICSGKKAKLIHFSTDYVFDGEKREPYFETDLASPISVYAESKRTGERNVLEVEDRHLVVRVSWLFGPDRPSFVDLMIKRAREEEQIEAVADKFSTPTYSLDIARVLPRFFPWHRLPADVPQIIDKMSMPRILHFTNAGECSWQEYAQFALDCCRSLGMPLKARMVGALKLTDMKNWVARRPPYTVLSTEKFFSLTGTTPRNWRDAVGEYVKNFYSPK